MEWVLLSTLEKHVGVDVVVVVGVVVVVVDVAVDLGEISEISVKSAPQHTLTRTGTHLQNTKTPTNPLCRSVSNKTIITP